MDLQNLLFDHQSLQRNLSCGKFIQLIILLIVNGQYFANGGEINMQHLWQLGWNCCSHCLTSWLCNCLKYQNQPTSVLLSWFFFFLKCQFSNFSKCGLYQNSLQGPCMPIGWENFYDFSMSLYKRCHQLDSLNLLLLPGNIIIFPPFIFPHPLMQFQTTICFVKNYQLVLQMLSLIDLITMTLILFTTKSLSNF